MQSGSILSNSPRTGRIINMLLNQKYIIIQDQYQTERISEKQSRKPNTYFLITKSKKSLQKIRDLVSFLLSLEPPSYIVTPVRDIGNKFFLSLANTKSLLTITIPTNTGMDFVNLVRNTSDNYDEIRSCTSFPNI